MTIDSFKIRLPFYAVLEFDQHVLVGCLAQLTTYESGQSLEIVLEWSLVKKPVPKQVLALCCGVCVRYQPVGRVL